MENRRFFLHDGAAVSAEWAWTIGSTPGDGIVTLPSAKSGGACLIDAGRLLVAGITGSQGWLAEVVFANNAGAITANVNHIGIGQMDMCKIAYVPGASVVMGVDNNTGNLMAASYSPGLLLGQWQIVASRSTCPLLRVPTAFLRTAILSNGMGIRLSATGLYRGRGVVEVTQSTSGDWSIVDPALGGPAASLPQIWLVSAYPVLNATSTEYEIWVGGGVGPFNVIDVETGGIVWSATHGGSLSGEVFVIPAPVLHLGKLYAIDSGPGSGYFSSTPFRAESVWERASVDPNMLPTKVGIRWDFPAVGSDFISWELYWGTAAPQPTDPILLTMIFGLWDYGFNPTAPVLGVDLLAAPLGDLGAQIATWDNRGVVSFGWVVAVNNPSFVGVKVALQAVGVLPTGQLIASDVAGMLLVQ